MSVKNVERDITAGRDGKEGDILFCQSIFLFFRYPPLWEYFPFFFLFSRFFFLNGIFRMHLATVAGGAVCYRRPSPRAPSEEFRFLFWRVSFSYFSRNLWFFFHPLMVAEKENSQGMVLAYFTEFYRVRLLFLVVVVVSSTILKSQLHGDWWRRKHQIVSKLSARWLCRGEPQLLAKPSHRATAMALQCLGPTSPLGLMISSKRKKKTCRYIERSP